MSFLWFLLDVSAMLTVEFGKYIFFGNYRETMKTIIFKLSKKNILYVKFFQAIAMNHFLLDNVLNEEIIKYTDNVPFSEEDIDYETMDVLSKMLNASIDVSRPINAGTISLVYIVDTENDIGLGNKVVIKIKRKNIEARLSEATEKIRVFGYLCSFVPFLNRMHLPDVIKKNVESLNAQLNFEQEVFNMQETKEVCRHMDYIRVPNVVNYITKEYKNVIVMEYLEGRNIANVDKSEYEVFGKMIIKYAFASFVYGIVHGDLHGGNILFMDNQIGIIDFGLITRIHPGVRDNMSNLIPELFSKSGAYLAEKIFVNFVDHDKVFQSLDQEEVKKMCEIGGGLIDDFRDKKKSFYESVSEIIIYLNTCIQKKGGKINDDYAKLQWAFVMTHGLSLHLFEENYIKCMNDVMNELFHYDVFENRTV